LSGLSLTADEVRPQNSDPSRQRIGRNSRRDLAGGFSEYRAAQD
jgi:hypothetical protein